MTQAAALAHYAQQQDAVPQHLLTSPSQRQQGASLMSASSAAQTSVDAQIEAALQAAIREQQRHKGKIPRVRVSVLKAQLHECEQ